MLKKRLLTPGPTDVPPEVLVEMAKPIFHHRTSEFRQMFAAVNEGLKTIFRTKNLVLTLAGSGTSGMEAAISCACPRDKKTLVANGGKFGERWVKVAKLHGLNVEEVRQEWGTAISAGEIETRLAAGGYGAVVVVYSETSTATACDLPAIARVVAKTDAILIVDAITACGTLPLETDAWGVDIVVSGSQKAFMLPPGLSMVSVSEKAWKNIEAIKAPSIYLDLKAYRKSIADDDMPYTAPVSLLRGLKVSVDMINAIGIETIWARCALLARALREAAGALGMRVCSQSPSDSVTGLFLPEGVDDGIRKVLQKKYGFNVAGGQDHWTGKVIRVSHMGYVDPFDTIGLVAALEYTLSDLGVKVETGKAVAVAAKVLKEWK